jgi:hypothetical protein
MEKTAVEWLLNQLGLEELLVPTDIVNKAKEMEKQQLEKFYNHGQFAIIDHGHGDEFAN